MGPLYYETPREIKQAIEMMAQYRIPVTVKEYVDCQTVIDAGLIEQPSFLASEKVEVNSAKFELKNIACIHGLTIYVRDEVNNV